jgi:hypothetical protein
LGIKTRGFKVFDNRLDVDVDALLELQRFLLVFCFLRMQGSCVYQ